MAINAYINHSFPNFFCWNEIQMFHTSDEDRYQYIMDMLKDVDNDDDSHRIALIKTFLQSQKRNCETYMANNIDKILDVIINDLNRVKAIECIIDQAAKNKNKKIFDAVVKILACSILSIFRRLTRDGYRVRAARHIFGDGVHLDIYLQNLRSMMEEMHSDIYKLQILSLMKDDASAFQKVCHEFFFTDLDYLFNIEYQKQAYELLGRDYTGIKGEHLHSSDGAYRVKKSLLGKGGDNVEFGREITWEISPSKYYYVKGSFIHWHGFGLGIDSSKTFKATYLRCVFSALSGNEVRSKILTDDICETAKSLGYDLKTKPWFVQMQINGNHMHSYLILDEMVECDGSRFKVTTSDNEKYHNLQILW